VFSQELATECCPDPDKQSPQSHSSLRSVAFISIKVQDKYFLRIPLPPILVILDLINLTVFAKQCKLWSLSLRRFTHIPLLPCPLGLNMPFIIFFSVLTLILLMWRIGWANTIPIYIQQDAKLRRLFISGKYSTRFGWYFHPSSGAHKPVSTTSAICHTVTAICRYRGRVGTGLSVLCVAYATHSTLKPVPTLPR
jgi:hypothetical protein